jgi:alcohol dehydrogenase class IV
MEYVNRPVGEGKAPSGPLKPLIAVPTTAGTGAESTPVCVLDILGIHVKSGISHPRLRPTLARSAPSRAALRRSEGRRRETRPHLTSVPHLSPAP